MTSLEEPDKGYAWVVLFSAYIINLILSGMTRMIALLYVGLIDAFGITREMASLPFTLRNAVRYIAGPLTGILGQTYGIKAVTFWGGVIATLGSVLCFFAPNITYIVIFWGLVHGLGFALANTLFQVVINQYFEKHRATASGIVLSGACIGSFIFPFMIDTMIDNYGIFGCFLLLGGLFLHILPPSLLLKSPPWIEFPEAYARKRAEILQLQSNEKSKKKQPFTLYKPQKKGHFQITEQSNGLTPDSNQKFKQLNFQTDVYYQEKVICTLYHLIDVEDTPRQEKATNLQNVFLNPAFIPDSEMHDNRSERKNEKTSKAISPKKNENLLAANLHKMLQLYRNPIYILISLTVAAYFATLLPVYGVLVDYARDKGISRESEKFLIYSLAVGDLFGRMGFGWVTDRKLMSFPNFMVLAFILQAAFTALLPVSTSLIINIIVVGLFGITAGINFVHFPVLAYKYVDKENQSNAIGCIGLLSSISSFGIPPLIGYFRDHVGSYDGLFYIVAILSVIIAALWLLVSFYEKQQSKKSET